MFALVIKNHLLIMTVCNYCTLSPPSLHNLALLLSSSALVSAKLMRFLLIKVLQLLWDKM